MNPLCVECKERPVAKYDARYKAKYKPKCWKCNDRLWQTRHANESQATKDRKLVWQVRKAYGITLEEYRDLKRLQENRCYICGKIGGDLQRTCLCLDHNHSTGKIRKFLCRKCNWALAVVENEDYHQKLIDYLEEHK